MSPPRSFRGDRIAQWLHARLQSLLAGGPSHHFDDGSRGWSLFLTAVFALVLLLLLWRHEMWRDELQAWLLVRDSSSLVDLWHNSRYEGHPLLWHMMLFPLAHLFAQPAVMKVLHWVIAVGCAALVVYRAPFPMLIKGAIIFSYLPLYEYGVISRNYGLTMLGVWLFCVLLQRSRTCLWSAGGGVIAANASVMGVLLTVALIPAMWLRASGSRRRAAAVLLAVGALVATLQALPAEDYEHARGWYFSLDTTRAVYVARGFVTAVFPILSNNLHFWNSAAWFPWPGPGKSPGGMVTAVAFLGLFSIFGIVVWTVRKSWVTVAMWVVGSTALIGFAYVKFPGTTRHHGFWWVLMVATFWIAVDSGIVTRRRATAMLSPVLLVGLAASGIAAWWDWRAPFSGARCAAESIYRRGIDDLPLVGGVDWAASGVAAYLPQGNLYYPAKGDSGSFIIWNLDRLRQQDLSQSDLVQETFAQDRGQGAVLLINRPLRGPTVGECREVFRCAPVVVSDERLWGYLCGGEYGPHRDLDQDGDNEVGQDVRPLEQSRLQ